MDINFVINIIGWLGSIAVLLAYVFVSTNRLKGDSVPYQMLNLFGSIFLMANTIYFGAYPSTFVNLVWLFIAIFALVRAVKK
ncbi:MAG: hypothetical protein HZB51_18545 [Chloroflexi bacterium]|nr:hypothetical protein [Chloroflexota bacterium]